MRREAGFLASLLHLPPAMGRPNSYTPIAEYGLIGNRHTCALVARDGSMDWCCIPHLDSPSVFAAVLDVRRGGHWSVRAAGEVARTRRYLGHSAVLETISRGGGGVLRQVDFLPIRSGRGREHSHSAESIVRIAECVEGEVEVEVDWMPRPNYARADVRLRMDGEVLVACHDQGSFWLAGLPREFGGIVDASVRGSHRLRAGERIDLISGWGPAAPAHPGAATRALLEETLEWWGVWSRSCRVEAIAEPWAEAVVRSGMVLKLLTNERTGAIAAAPTTSLPEEIGGVRNWDYRYCWVRDASMISQAFLTLGQPRDGLAFLEFLERAAQQHNDPARIRVLYALDGRRTVTEYTLGHLDGYRDSRPVRIGNGAAEQRQLDVYGELLEAAYDLVAAGHPTSADRWRWLASIADYVCRVWRWKDRGIWEVRGPDQHFTYSKLMCWVALDRAVRLARRMDWRDGVARWRQERDAIRAAILEQGFDSRRGTFVQSFGGTSLDASNLLIPLVGFLPPDDPRVIGTLDATLADLTENGLVHRYLPEETEDGVSGGEGAFGICTFWLSDALARAGRIEAACEIFDSMLARANDLGLYPEEFDPRTGEFLGNFPQAFTHVGLISGAHFLGSAMAGMDLDRERRSASYRAGSDSGVANERTERRRA